MFDQQADVKVRLTELTSLAGAKLSSYTPMPVADISKPMLQYRWRGFRMK